MTFWRRYRKLHSWLACDLGVIALFLLLRGNRGLMNALSQHVTQPLKTGIAAVTYLVPFSVAEVFYAAAVIGVAAYLVWTVAVLVRRGGKRARVYRSVTTLACAGLMVYAVFCLLWGVNYYCDGFQEKSGVWDAPVAAEDLATVTAYFADRLAETADNVPRNAAGVFDAAQDDIFAASTQVYVHAAEQYPFLAVRDRVPKKMLFSRIMSYMNFTGFYFAFTGESNLNVDCPGCLLPATIAHELAHQRGIASEQECNFLAVLSTTTCGDDTYAYSGWLLGFIHLSNALYTADYERWEAIYQSLPDTVRADLHDNNEYWKQLETPAADLTQKVYEGMLKSYGEERGLKSYGAVVDLLVVYYGSAAGKVGA